MKAVYFPITTNNYSTTKSCNIRMEYGWSGYGIYFAILQKLASTETRSYKLSELKALAFDLHLTLVEIQPIIEKYFESDGQTFHSDDLNEWLSYYDTKYQKHSEGGKKSAENMTPEQRLARSQKANEAKKSINLTTKEPTPNYNLTTKDATPNNRIEYNRIEQKKKEENRTEQNAEKVLDCVLRQSLASPPSGSLTPSQHNPMGNDKSVILNENTSHNIPNQDLERSDNTESTPTKNLVNTNTNSKENKPMTYNIQEIQKEIENYRSSYFVTDNYEYITNSYNEFKKTIPTVMTLATFERFIYYHFYCLWQSENPRETITNEYLNKYIFNNRYQVNNLDFLKTVDLITSNSEVKNHYTQALNLTIPKPQPLPRVYTQEQIDNYEDLPL
jgi:uncharacterized protein YdaU (DUF1376 family)